MLQHYLLIAFRSFKRNKTYSLLNIAGLTVGIACALTIFLFVSDELTYDSNHLQAPNIHRLNDAYQLPNNGGFEQYAVSNPAVGEVIANDFPEIKQVVRIIPNENTILQHPRTQEKLYETVYSADSNIFKVFTFSFISGNPDEALKELRTLVVSRKAALKYFGRADVLNENIRLVNDTIEYRIAGVIEDAPANSHFRPDFISSMETYKVRTRNNLQTWWMFAFHTYLLLEPNADVKALSDKIQFISRKYIPDQEDNSGYKHQFSLTPLLDIHLHSDFRGEMEANSKSSYVIMFMIIGVFILIMACINFMNLATARSAMRAREIGLRKVAGAVRRELIGQFLGEAFIVTVFASILSIGVVYFGLPFVNNFSGKSLSIGDSTYFWPGVVAITVFVALLAGSYPSFFLSAFRPSETLKGNFKSSAKGNSLRKVLVVFQFAISVFLIGGTLIIINHLQYIRSIDLGFDQERVVIIPLRSSGGHGNDSRFASLKSSMERNSNVASASVSSSVPGKDMDNNVVRLGWDSLAAYSDMRFITVDFDFMSAYKIEMIAGRSFDEKYSADVDNSFLVNESGMRRLGFNSAEEALGTKLWWQNRKGTLIGVVKDFHYMSANVAIEPFLVTMNTPRSPRFLSVRMNAGDPSANLEAIRNTFAEALPDQVFEYSFLDESFDRQYKAEDRFMTIFTFFAFTAIVIACLGLYGLGMFMAEQKFREVGIRKVLGASEASLWALMTSGFVKLVGIAILIAVPVTYWAMNNWLQTFPLHKSVSPLLLAGAGLAAVAIAVITVSYQTIRTARTNPVKALKE